MAGHLESMFISSQDLAELTASKHSAIQARWLCANGFPFILGGDGVPKVGKHFWTSLVSPTLTPNHL